MGIKGLNKYLQEKKFFHDVSLSDYNAVVIDGNNICFQLYVRKAIDWKRGGEYKEFSTIVESFFENLAKNKVSPIVVIEGLKDSTTKRCDNSYIILDDLQKNGKSKNDQIILPILVLPTFLIIAQQMHCEIHISAGEGDLLTAAISKERQCPVLAFDSDYYMHELQYGYIPFDDSFKPPKCKLYHTKYFQDHFKLPEPMMRLLIPAIHGNDFIQPIKQSHQEFDDTIEELKSYDNCEKYLAKKRHLYENYKTAKKYYYDIKPPQAILQDHIGETPSFQVNVHDNSIETHFCLIRMTTATRTHVMKYAVEKISRESVWNCSQYIRQFMYGILGVEKVKEKIRKEGDVTQDSKDVTHRHLNPRVAINGRSIVIPPKNEDLPLDYKKEIVLTVLKCKKMTDECHSELLNLPLHLQLPVATAFYWYRTSHFAATKKLLKVLLFCFLDIKVPDVHTQEQFSWENVHVFSEWQSVYSDALALNYMVHSPFVATNPGTLFSGKKALHCARSDFDDILDERSKVLLMKMLKIVTSRKEKVTEIPAPTATTTATPSPAD